MSHYQAKNLLVKAATYYRRQKESVSKMEIRKKINEIKYLSAQKKVPKISLRKEIIHLENTLEGVFELEKTLLMQQQRESVKVNALKAEIAALKRLLAVSGDKNLKNKVDHISHVLGEFKAREDIGKDIVLSQKAIAERSMEKGGLSQETIDRVHLLEHRLKALKDELSKAGKDEETVMMMERKIGMIEASLINFHREHPELRELKNIPLKPTTGHLPFAGLERNEEKELRGSPEFVKSSAFRKPGVKHTFVLGGPDDKKQIVLSKEEEIALEQELPLPPPPRMG